MIMSTLVLGVREFGRTVIPRVKLARVKANSNYKVRWENQVIYITGIQIRDQSKNCTCGLITLLITKKKKRKQNTFFVNTDIIFSLLTQTLFYSIFLRMFKCLL